MNLSEHLEDLRKQHDLTQDQLAEKLTVTRQAISRWERGLAYPTVDNLKALALAWVAAVLALLALLVAGTALYKVSQLEQDPTDSTNVWQTGSPQDTNPTITFSFAE